MDEKQLHETLRNLEVLCYLMVAILLCISSTLTGENIFWYIAVLPMGGAAYSVGKMLKGVKTK
jgi:hypothetical protein